MARRKETTIERIYREVTGNKMPAAVKRILFAKTKNPCQERERSILKRCGRRSMRYARNVESRFRPPRYGASTLSVSSVRSAENSLCPARKGERTLGAGKNGPTCRVGPMGENSDAVTLPWNCTPLGTFRSVAKASWFSSLHESQLLARPAPFTSFPRALQSDSQ
jgi:hypothetical protein